MCSRVWFSCVKTAVLHTIGDYMQEELLESENHLLDLSNVHDDGPEEFSLVQLHRAALTFRYLFKTFS